MWLPTPANADANANAKFMWLPTPADADANANAEFMRLPATTNDALSNAVPNANDATNASANESNATTTEVMSLVIKENCWKWESAKGDFFMKYYEDVYIAQKVKTIHKKLKSIQFPYHLNVEKNGDTHILKQSWYEGRSADFSKVSDQQKTLQALQALHQTNEQIRWQEIDLLPYYDLREKWYRRFERFIEHERELKVLLRDDYKKIVTMASDALNRIDGISTELEERTLLHGDVVHHNFMFGKDDVKLVDFDLAAMGERTDELILWLHRVLPNVGYDLKSVMQEHSYLQHVRQKAHFLLFPNEIMREALFYLKLSPRQKQGTYPFIKKFSGDVLRHEKKLTQMVLELA